MRQALTTATAIGLLMATAGAASAADWKPSGPIKLIIAFTAGGGADTQARLIAEELEKRRGWKLIPEQATGKDGLVAAAKLKDQPKDGTAIAMLVSHTLGYNLVAAKRAPVKLADFTPITTTASFQMGVVALSKSGWNTFNDAIATAKGGKKIRFGVMSSRLADLAFLLGKANGVEFNIVSYRGGKGVMDALNAGDADVGFIAGLQTKAVKAGDMVELASANSKPLTTTPGAPLIKDLGVKFDADGYFMFVAPAGIPAAARDALASAIGEAAKDGKTRAGQFINRAFGGPDVLAGANLDRFMAQGITDAKALLKAVSK